MTFPDYLATQPDHDLRTLADALSGLTDAHDLGAVIAHLHATEQPEVIGQLAAGAWREWRKSWSALECRLGALTTTARQEGRTVRVVRDERGGWSARLLDATGTKCEALAGGVTAQEACDRLEAKISANSLGSRRERE